MLPFDFSEILQGYYFKTGFRATDSITLKKWFFLILSPIVFHLVWVTTHFGSKVGRLVRKYVSEDSLSVTGTYILGISSTYSRTRMTEQKVNSLSSSDPNKTTWKKASLIQINHTKFIHENDLAQCRRQPELGSCGWKT